MKQFSFRPARANGAAIEIIATGLTSPRGLGFSSNGDLYVAEAANGGNSSGGHGNPVSLHFRSGRPDSPGAKRV